MFKSLWSRPFLGSCLSASLNPFIICIKIKHSDDHNKIKHPKHPESNILLLQIISLSKKIKSQWPAILMVNKQPKCHQIGQTTMFPIFSNLWFDQSNILTWVVNHLLIWREVYYKKHLSCEFNLIVMSVSWQQLSKEMKQSLD